MAVAPFSNHWDPDACLEVVPCPGCGWDEWLFMRGNGYWCANCNTRCTARESQSDTAYVLTFDLSATWRDDADGAPPEAYTHVSAKLLGMRNPGLEWLGTPYNPDTGERFNDDSGRWTWPDNAGLGLYD